MVVVVDADADVQQNISRNLQEKLQNSQESLGQTDSYGLLLRRRGPAAELGSLPASAMLEPRIDPDRAKFGIERESNLENTKIKQGKHVYALLPV